MVKNIGAVERMIRALAGVGLMIFAVLTGQPWWLEAIAGVLLATAAIGWCPPYALLGFSTAKKH